MKIKTSTPIYLSSWSQWELVAVPMPAGRRVTAALVAESVPAKHSPPLQSSCHFPSQMKLIFIQKCKRVLVADFAVIAKTWKNSASEGGLLCYPLTMARKLTVGTCSHPVADMWKYEWGEILKKVLYTYACIAITFCKMTGMKTTLMVNT